jgi:hypothetical protein
VNVNILTLLLRVNRRDFPPEAAAFAPTGAGLSKTIYGEATYNRTGMKDEEASFPAN